MVNVLVVLKSINSFSILRHSIVLHKLQKTAELGYDVMKVTECFVSL